MSATVVTTTGKVVARFRTFTEAQAFCLVRCWHIGEDGLDIIYRR